MGSSRYQGCSDTPTIHIYISYVYICIYIYIYIFMFIYSLRKMDLPSSPG